MTAGGLTRLVSSKLATVIDLRAYCQWRMSHVYRAHPATDREVVSTE